MDDKTERLESLRRVAERLRQIADDPFARNLAQRLDDEIEANCTPAGGEIDDAEDSVSG